MSRKTERSKLRSNPEFESPDGVRIQINRGGNKMQFIRDLCRNKKITAIQFRMLVPLVDASNEGTDDDRSRWGKSWLSLENLAKESGCSKRAVEKNLPKLEKAGIVVVARDLDDEGRSTGGKSHVNEYWLPGWNKFGAVSQGDVNSEQRSPFEDGNSERGTEKQRTADQQTANAGRANSERRSPDSPHSPNPETQPNPTQSAPASGERGPAVDLNDDRQPPKPANENVEIEPRPYDINAMVDKFLSYYPRGGDYTKIAEALDEIRREGKTEFKDILRGASNYKRESASTDPQWITNPENFLRKRLWKGYQQDHRQRPQPAMAI